MGIVVDIPTHDEKVEYEKELIEQMESEGETPHSASVWLMTLCESIKNQHGYKLAMYLRAKANIQPEQTTEG